MIPIIIVARNGIALTKNAVRSALQQDVLTGVMVIDNCSSDGTSQWLRAKAKTEERLSYVTPSDQWSLAECWNTALRSFWEVGCDRALVINNDVVLRSDTVRMLDAHGGPFVTCVSVDDMARLGTPGDRNIDDLRANEREHPDYSAWFIRKEVTDKNIWFDEDCYPAYCEDSFHHVAMHQAGIRAVCIDLPFYHYAAGTLKNADPRDARIIRQGADRNRERFKARYGCYPGGPGYEELFSAETFGNRTRQVLSGRDLAAVS